MSDENNANRMLMEQMFEIAKENQRSLSQLAVAMNKRRDVVAEPANGRFHMVLTLIGTLAVLLIVLVQGGQNTSGAVLQALSEKLDQEMEDRKAAVVLLDITLQNELEKSAISIEKGITSLDAISNSRHKAQQEELIYRYETLAERMVRIEATLQ